MAGRPQPLLIARPIKKGTFFFFKSINLQGHVWRCLFKGGWGRISSLLEKNIKSVGEEYQVCWGRISSLSGKNINSVGKDYQVCWERISILLGKNIKFERGEGYIKALGKNIAGKRGNGKNYIFSFILRLLQRISRGIENFGKNIKIRKWGWGRISSCKVNMFQFLKICTWWSARRCRGPGSPPPRHKRSCPRHNL